MAVLLALAVLTWYPDSARLVATGPGGDLIGSVTSARVSVRDSRGRLHVVFSKNWGSPVAESSDVFHTFSTDDGLTWSQPLAISRNGDTLSTNPALAVELARPPALRLVGGLRVGRPLLPVRLLLLGVRR